MYFPYGMAFCIFNTIEVVYYIVFYVNNICGSFPVSTLSSFVLQSFLHACILIIFWFELKMGIMWLGWYIPTINPIRRGLLFQTT